MSNIQYTIRSIPPKVDAVLRNQAKRSGKSLNEIIIVTLAKGAGVVQGDDFTDLDWFIGNKSLGDSFKSSMQWLDKAPKDIK